MKKNSLLFLIACICLFFLFGCQTTSKKDRWVQVMQFIKSDSLTANNFNSRFSNKAISQIMLSRTNDTLSYIKDFFLNLESEYKIETKGEFTYIKYDYKNKISGGPIIKIRNIDQAWLIDNITRGL